MRAAYLEGFKNGEPDAIAEAGVMLRQKGVKGLSADLNRFLLRNFRLGHIGIESPLFGHVWPPNAQLYDQPGFEPSAGDRTTLLTIISITCSLAASNSSSDNGVPPFNTDICVAKSA